MFVITRVRVIDRLLAGLATPDDAPDGAKRQGEGNERLRHQRADGRVGQRNEPSVIHPPDDGKDESQQCEVDDFCRCPQTRVEKEGEGESECEADDHHPERELRRGDPVVVAVAACIVKRKDNSESNQESPQEKRAEDTADHVGSFLWVAREREERNAIIKT